MSWLSAVISGAAGLGSSALQSQMNRGLMKYQFELNQRSLRESPMAQKQGLIAAGYNPLLAVSNGISSPTVGGSSVSLPDLSAFGQMLQEGDKKSREGKLIEKQIERQDTLLESELEKLKAESDSAMAHSGAAMYDAETRRMEALARIEKIKKESDSIAPPARKSHDYISAGKEVVAPIASAAATAYAGKKAGDAVKALTASGLTKNSAKDIIKDVAPKAASSARHANSLWPVLSGLLLSLSPYALGAGSSALLGSRMIRKDKKIREKHGPSMVRQPNPLFIGH